MATDINSMTFEELVPSNSKYLSKSDVGEDGLLLTIKGFRSETINTDDGSAEDKMVMHFMESGVKPMVVNRTNAQLLGVVTSVKTAGEARGKKIVVYNDPTVGFGGKITGGLRIRKALGAPKAPVAAEPDDSIPF